MAVTSEHKKVVMNSKLESLLSLLLTISVVVVASVVVYREVSSRSTQGQDGRRLSAEFKSEWTDALPWGVELGDSSSSTKLFVFNDLECGGCRRFHADVVEKIIRDGGVSVKFIHRPLSSHRFALGAARAAECASQQGHFAAFVDVLFAKQDSFGLKPWLSYGRDDAAIRGVGEFEGCLQGNQSFERIEAGIAIADRFDVSATPTVMLNGWKFNRPPSLEEVRQSIRATERGRSPVGK